jgi:hypothetical protein
MNATMISTTASKLVPYQVRVFGPKPIAGYGRDSEITATVRHDDRCDNRHNTFSITAEVVTPASRTRRDIEAGGCMHEEIARIFPELAPFIQWHLVSTVGPLHYIENTLYWLGRRGYTNGKPGDPPNLAHARDAACWPKMPAGYVITGTVLSNVTIEAVLMRRLPALLARFRTAVESLGLVY